ncbi:TorF family putative porin [Elongatibacter sediminis]|uniref:TorF family putative porin n=1 Tax=Elongatibacter sediminis TaxID=3119006 RepID=A0AAW9RBG9_9GAMM
MGTCSKSQVLGWSAALAALLVSNAAEAELSGTLALTSDYDYRGFSQTADDSAVQGSLDYAHESGLYASLWGSSLDWGSDSDAWLELDWVIGYAQELGSTGVTWDVGLLFYQYPDLSSANFLEFYGGLSWSLFSVKLSYSDDFAGVDESGWYADASVGYEFDNGVSLFVYGGYSFGNAFDEDDGGPAFGSPDYWNYGFGAGYSVGDNLYFELKGVGTDLDGIYKIDDGVFDNSFRAIASMTVSFP